jgi:hypothetical protein
MKFKIKKQKIGFILQKYMLHNKEIIENPVPARTLTPQWYKDIPYYEGNNQYIHDIGNGLTVKACVPFLDALNFGYFILTSEDIQVSQQFSEPRISWRQDPEPIKARKNHEYLQQPLGCSKTQFAWNLPYGIKLPKGYSALLTHPLNRNDLPFITSSGVIDDGVDWGGNISFWIKDNFEGIIPVGTPIVQIMPFKREGWQLEIRDDLINDAKLSGEKIKKYRAGYKKYIHKKKNFN